jgi:hypothetical protein
MPRCQVAGCQDPDTHVTAGHRCGVCGRHGHGEAEHGDVAARLGLRAHAADVVGSPCRVPGCPHPTHHTTAGHRCARCREPGHRAANLCHGRVLRVPRACRPQPARLRVRARPLRRLRREVRARRRLTAAGGLSNATGVSTTWQRCLRSDTRGIRKIPHAAGRDSRCWNSRSKTSESWLGP